MVLMGHGHAAISSILINVQLETSRQREMRGGAGQTEDGGRDWRMRRAGGGSCWVQQRAQRTGLQDREAERKRTERS